MTSISARATCGYSLITTYSITNWTRLRPRRYVDYRATSAQPTRWLKSEPAVTRIPAIPKQAVAPTVWRATVNLWAANWLRMCNGNRDTFLFDMGDHDQRFFGSKSGRKGLSCGGVGPENFGEALEHAVSGIVSWVSLMLLKCSGSDVAVQMRHRGAQPRSVGGLPRSRSHGDWASR